MTVCPHCASIDYTLVEIWDKVYCPGCGHFFGWTTPFDREFDDRRLEEHGLYRRLEEHSL